MGRFTKCLSVFFMVFSLSVIPNSAWAMDSDGGMYGRVEPESAEQSEIKIVNQDAPTPKTGKEVKKNDSLLGGLIQLTAAILVTVGGDSTSTKANTDTSTDIE